MSAPVVFRLEIEPDRQRYAALLSRTFHSPRERSDLYLAAIGRENLRGVRLDEEFAGGLALLPMGQYFGGRSVPMTGVAAVAIEPAARARGAASALMRAALTELHAGGVALSALYPATQPVYRRAGYEIAGSQFEVSLALRQIDVRDHELSLRPEREADRAGVESLYRRWAAARDGNLDRSAMIWDRVRDFRGERMDGYVVCDGERIEGYMYCVERAGAPFPHALFIQDVVAVTPAAGRRLLAFMAEHRSMCETGTFTSGPADALLAHLAEQAWKMTARTAWMLRLVDVRRALAARGYPLGLRGELHLEVRDDVLPQNAGRIVLAVADGCGEVRPGGRGAFRIDVRGLAALYSGHFSPAQAQACGYLDTGEDEQRVAAAMFGGPAPWMRDSF
ncbi:MAG: GNAT family N-acetyltransferase [Phycisphaerae bacterium]|jgi:predicted acetyltransferase|nr:GNAT family N-acetyltransferase [Phycisphaerae bacterium]MCZ2401090.1 GNAT family N-acetyltransferase [Phycisphaerae bacterium]